MMLGGDLYFLWKPKKGAKVARELFWQTLVWWISSQVLLAIKWEADRPAEHMFIVLLVPSFLIRPGAPQKHF